MIKIGELKEIVKVVLYSGYIAGEKPLSLFMVGKVGIGKTELLKHFRITDNIALFSDITYMGLIDLLKKHIEVRHIVVPDFLKITMKKTSTAQNIISCFNELTEEGIFKISLFGTSEDFKGKQAGLISATTKSSFEQHQRQWKSMGFISRMLIISYDYSQETIKEIFKYIYNREYLKENPVKIDMPTRNVEIELSPKLAKQLKGIDFRNQKQLQTLAMSITLSEDRKKVTQKDIERVLKFKKFLNLNFTEV